jgi:hypothetical protein
MLMQEKETTYRGGIMAFVPSPFLLVGPPDLWSKETKWDLVRFSALRGTRASPDADHLLGKTVQMIATMVMNMPGPDENNRTTLVVVPAALLHQVRSYRPTMRAYLLIQFV